MKKIVSLTVLLSCSLFLGGCMLRATGPCLGYGCPALSGTSDFYHAEPVANSQHPSAATEPKDQTSAHAKN